MGLAKKVVPRSLKDECKGWLIFNLLYSLQMTLPGHGAMVYRQCALVGNYI